MKVNSKSVGENQFSVASSQLNPQIAAVCDGHEQNLEPQSARRFRRGRKKVQDLADFTDD
jgi:hypothetical protein